MLNKRMGQSVVGPWNWLRVQLFRLWTAVFILVVYGYLWLNKPEYLTWWKRTIDYLIESSCDKLPYPWGDRIESTLGNFGIWVQLSLAILSFRAALGLALLVLRARFRDEPSRPHSAFKPGAIRTSAPTASRACSRRIVSSRFGLPRRKFSARAVKANGKYNLRAAPTAAATRSLA